MCTNTPRKYGTFFFSLNLLLNASKYVSIYRDLVSKLEEFLTENKKTYFLGEGFNALNLLYQLNQREHAISPSSSKQSIDLSQFGQYTVGTSISENKHEIQLVKNYLAYYKSSYQTDANISSLLMSYFSIHFINNLSTYSETPEIPLRSFVRYAEFHASKLETDLTPEFLDKKIRPAFADLIHFIGTRVKPDRYGETSAEWGLEALKEKKAYTFDLLTSIQSLLGKLINKFSKEVDTIIELFKLHLGIYASFLGQIKINKNSEKDLEYYAEVMDKDSLNEIIELIEIWFEKECSESLLRNYGIKPRTPMEIQEHESELRKLKEHKNNPSILQRMTSNNV